MEQKKYEMKDIPFEKLEIVGLTKQMIEDLPDADRDDILDGHYSPVLPLTVTGPDGKKNVVMGRFSVCRQGDGEPGIRILPVMAPITDRMTVTLLDADGRAHHEEVPTSDVYGERIIRPLLEGRIVRDVMKTPDGMEMRAYLQLDEETNNVIGVSAELLNCNMQVIARELRFTSSEMLLLQSGGIVTFDDDEAGMISVGMDLRSPTGIRFSTGDSDRWLQNRKRCWDKYELGFNGCWMTGGDGSVQYVPESDFDKYDIWTEIEKEREGRSRQEFLRKGAPMIK